MSPLFGTAWPLPEYAERGEFQVVLQVPGPKPVRVIKVVRQATGLSLVEAKQRVVDRFPSVVAQQLSWESAGLLVFRLQEAGAKATIAQVEQ